MFSLDLAWGTVRQLCASLLAAHPGEKGFPGAVCLLVVGLLGLSLLVPRYVRAQFRQQVTDIDAEGTIGFYAADLEGDGDQDLLTRLESEAKIAWHENQVRESGGDEDGFGPQQEITARSDTAKVVYAADLDGDGDKDALYASEGGKIAWHENQVGESEADADGFGDQQVIATNVNTTPHVQAADVDGDGDKDLLSGLAGNKIAWHENQVGESGAGSGGFGDQRVITTAVNGLSSISATDVDGDGNQDVVFASFSGRKIGWYESQAGERRADGDGFGDQQTITSRNDGARSILAMDIDGEGREDVLYASFGKIAWHKNDSGSFGTEKVIRNRYDRVVSADGADLDGDTDPDVVYGSVSGKIAWNENQVGESGADADGFGEQKVITTDPVTVYVQAADVDGDGDDDVFYTWQGKIGWYENTD